MVMDKLEALLPKSPRAVIAVTIPLVVSSVYLLLRSRRKYRNASLPPGPKPLPLIGNALDVPTESEYLTFREWARKYDSDILYFTALGQHMIVLDKYETAIELLEKRSGIYSSRQPIPMMTMMGGWDDAQFALTPYGEKWRRKRRLFHRILNEHTNEQYYPLVQKNTYRLLFSLLEEPENFMLLIHMISASTVMELAYGFPIASLDDARFVMFEELSRESIPACSPVSYPVNIFPKLQYIPSWFPGGGFKKFAAKWAGVSRTIIEGTFRDAKKKIFEDGDSTPSIVFDCLHENITDLNEEDIMSVAVSTYAAGADTSTATLRSFIQLMVYHPDVQKRAQEEVSRLCHPGQLPSTHDKASYHYVNAVIMEVIRWSAILPIGVPHMIENDDIYNGYHIPAKSVIIPNQWSMLHDEEAYPDPDRFNPDRFLKDGVINPDVRSPYDIIFGFGRRACPGKPFALLSLWTRATAILATLDLQKVPETDPEPKYAPSMVLHPVPFKCSIKPRSPEAEKFIRESYQNTNVL